MYRPYVEDCLLAKERERGEREREEMKTDMRATAAESHPVNGGDGIYSYTKNSYYQRAASSTFKTMVDEEIVEKLDVTSLTSTSTNTFRLADLGCSVGPNTFLNMQDVIETIKHKYHSQGVPEFQVFFNDHASNDFNTLFTSLPFGRNYFAAGVPGSFYGRLFPESSLHFVYSSHALQWLSQPPQECLDINSPAYNKGRIHYSNAPDVIADAYARQYAKDMQVFLDARAIEIVVGGMMVLIMPGCPDDVPPLSFALTLQLFESTLIDMLNKGVVSEAQVDSFNMPLYAACPKELAMAVERNGNFSIERLEVANPASMFESPIDWKALTIHFRAAFEGIFSKHFGSQIIDELFDRFYKKTIELFEKMESSSKEKNYLFVVLKRK